MEYVRYLGWKFIRRKDSEFKKGCVVWQDVRMDVKKTEYGDVGTAGWSTVRIACMTRMCVIVVTRVWIIIIVKGMTVTIHFRMRRIHEYRRV